jgi:eukaryotic-like serine/threonine-protein kinase
MPDLSRSRLSRSAVSPLSRSAVGRATGRLTRRLASASSVRRAGTFLRRQLWAWPLIAAVILGLSGLLVHRAVERAMRDQREAELTTIRDADVEALRVWMIEQGRNAEQMADDERLQAPLRELLTMPVGGPEAERALIQSKAQAAIRDRLGPRLKAMGYVGFFVVSPAGVVLAAEQDAPVSKPLGGYRQEFFDGVLAHGPSVSKPYRTPLLLKDANGEYRANLPTMFAAAALKDEAGKPVAALGLRIRPEEEFTRILMVARAGKSGETYAFDRDGLMLSNSRYDDDLKRVGLLADLPDSQSVLTIHVRDPGVNMSAGERPAVRRADQPLTRMAADCVAGGTGCDADGYRGYRGVPKVGAWTWLPEYDFGVATEIDKAESFAPVYILRTAFWSLLGLLGLAAVGIFVAMLVMARQHKQLQAAVLQAKQLGQYTLEDKLGAGGMGTVYRARHAMLRRPTAVKLLDPAQMSESAVVRFEREVQATSTLTHPNTIQIFDYGRTPEGIFYYAMELLEGANLDSLVVRTGPLPEARVIYLLKQVCGSLAEAHATGLVHRDVKPANLFLTRRGGLADFVKVLDFGLVKAVGGADEAHLTSANAVTGTPLYLSPEAVNEPDRLDARADVYALGAVAYYLLTGTPVFNGATVMEICLKHVREAPEPPSARLGKPVSSALEALILRCLAKARADRPGDAGALLRELEKCPVSGTWTADDAAMWWAAFSKAGPGPTSPPASPAVTTDQVPLDITQAYEAPPEQLQNR